MKIKRMHRPITNYHSAYITLPELLYYNNKTPVINPDKLKELVNRLDTTTRFLWTNDQFMEKKIGFDFYNAISEYTKNGKTVSYKQKAVALIKLPHRMNVENFKKIKQIHNGFFLRFNPTKEQKDIIGTIPNHGHPHTTGLGEGLNFFEPPFEDWESLKKYVLLQIDWCIFNPDEHRYNRMFYLEDQDQMNEMIETLFGEKITFADVVFPDRYYNHSSYGVYYIHNVIERRIDNTNYRFAIIQTLKDYTTHYRIIRIREDDPTYVYYDKNRIMIARTQRDRIKTFFLDTQINERDPAGSFVVDKRIISNIMDNIQHILPENENIITSQIYQFYKQRQQRNYYSTNNSDLTNKIRRKYLSLIQQGKDIFINGVKINKTEISLKDENFRFTFPENFIDMSNQFYRIQSVINSDIKYNLNEFFERILDLSVIQRLGDRYYNNNRDFGEYDITLNGMKVNISKKTSRLRINDIYCRIADTKYILSKLICYDDVKEFEKYVEDVSHIGVDYVKMINNGVLINMYSPFMMSLTNNNNSVLLRFSLFWDKVKRTQIYLKLNDKKYKIRYKAKFRKFFNYPKRQTTITKLKEELTESLEHLDDNILLEIIEDAVVEAKIVKERGEELVKITVKEVGAEETEVIVRGGKKYGYLLTGLKTKAKYFIEKDTLSVFKFMDGSWNKRCIVDNHNKQRIYEDKLANRLYNIHNEPSYLSSYLQT